MPLAIPVARRGRARDLLSSRLLILVVRLASNFAGSRRTRALAHRHRFRAAATRKPELPVVRSSPSSRKTRNRSTLATVFQSSLWEESAHPCRLAKAGPAVQRNGPVAPRYLARNHGLATALALEEDASSSNCDNRLTLTSTIESIDSLLAVRARKLFGLEGRRHLTVRAELRWIRARFRAVARRTGVARSLAGSRSFRALRATPSGRGVVGHGRRARSTSDALLCTYLGREPEAGVEHRRTIGPSRTTATRGAPSAFHRRVLRHGLAPMPKPATVSRFCHLAPASDADSPLPPWRRG
jgi:hypothetical protein